MPDQKHNKNYFLINVILWSGQQALDKIKTIFLVLGAAACR